MNSISATARRSYRLALPVAALAVAASAGFAGAGVASAHVSANAPTVTQGGYGVVSLVVPNESESAPTTELTVRLPKLKSARPEAMPGWKSSVVKDPASAEVTSITWTALPGNPGIPVGEFGQFRLSGGPFPEQESVTLPALQTYADGEKVDWAQPMGPDGAEPEHPAPTLTLPAGSADGGHGAHGGATAAAHEDSASSSTTDGGARWMAGIGLVLGAIGALAGLASLARNRRGGSDA